MNVSTIYMNQWLRLHPYKVVQPSDAYYVALANRLVTVITVPFVAQETSQRMALYLAAYLEDQVSHLMLWRTFLKEHKRLYGTWLPFYDLSNDYYVDEVNREDVAFLVWNTCQKELQHMEGHSVIKGDESEQDTPVVVSADGRMKYVNPIHPMLLQLSDYLYDILAKAYEEAPENEILINYFQGYTDADDADTKLSWLFAHTYLTEPALLPYIDNVAMSDRFIIPTGPLALFLYEWVDALGGGTEWKNVPGLYVQEPELPAAYKVKNQTTYADFIAATQGRNIVFLNGYEALRNFLVHALHWPDDENHTMPQLREFHDFILMVDPDKGMLLAKDVCRFLAAPNNPMYDQETAKKGALKLLTEEMVCPPDLLYRSIKEGWIQDAQLPGCPFTRQLVVRNADFIARHSLLYYYRGD